MMSNQEGEWLVTSPVYAGSAERVEKMMQCPHTSWWAESSKADEGFVMIREVCRGCGAGRVRYKAEEEE